MQDRNKNNSRIARNTLVLYVRMALLLLVGLYTSRVILNALGVSDYGIYNVVGGFVAMFQLISWTLSSSTGRFLTYELGRDNQEALKRVFSTGLSIQFILCGIVILVGETVGLWFVNTHMNFPVGREFAANWVFQLSLFAFCLDLICTPYNADIIAHEKMSAFAYISIFEAFANLGIVYLLHVVNADKLALYAILLMLVKISVIMIYRIYCKRHFFESGFRWLFDKILLKEMLAFTSWNLFGGIAGTLMGQGINVLLNLFFGPVVNAARGVAVQVQSAVQLFSTNFQTALNPQMMKSYAAGDLQAMHVLLFRSAKFTFMLLLCLMLPLMLEINTVLGLWLKEVPKYTNIFVCLMLCISMVDAVSNPFMTASAATGRVKKYQSIVGSILLLIVPLAYISLKLGAEPYAVFIVHLTIAIIAFIARMLIIRKMIDLSIREYIKNAILPCIKVALPSIFVSLAVKYIFPNGLQYAVIVVITTLVIVLVISYLFGLTDSERRFVSSKIPILNR